LQHPVVYVLLITIVMLVVFVPLSIRRFASLSR
jgi:ABC-2 type transport system permease protein